MGARNAMQVPQPTVRQRSRKVAYVAALTAIVGGSVQGAVTLHEQFIKRPDPTPVVFRAPDADRRAANVAPQRAAARAEPPAEMPPAEMPAAEVPAAELPGDASPVDSPQPAGASSEAVALASAPDQAEDSADRNYADELPRIAPHEPGDALATFQTRPGFRIELVAAEPLVNDPVAMAFDADGRLLVVEMRDYSEQAHDRLGQVRLLEDTNGDGRMDRSTVFADDLSWPTAVACYDGGIFVAAAPDILYLKDTDGDGRADVRRVVYTGLGRSNVQGLVNTFLWGLDSRIHAATSSSGAQLVPADHPQAEPLVLRGRDFAFDPSSGALEATSGGGQHGMSFDRWGRKFVSSNSDHIQMVMFEDRYLARNPYLAAPSPRVSIAADGPQAEVFRVSPVEPWRIVRTRLRLKGVVPGVVEGGGRAAGYFTGATGVTIYHGDAWPAEYLDNAFVGDVGSNIVHRKVLEPRGVELLARRAAGEEQVEFVASEDIWFRPAQFANAPDGTLYIADVYREVIEHPDSLPPPIKKHLDLTSGRDRGRIYRIVPEAFRQPPLPRLSTATIDELVAALEHAGGWHRETAARLLYERQDAAAVEPLKRLAATSSRPEGRLHALYALDGLGSLDAAVVLAALDDPHPRVREHAVRLSERVLASASEIRARLYTMTADDDARVRYQLAFTLGQCQGPSRVDALAALARRDADDRWTRLALLSSVADEPAALLAELAADTQFRRQPGGAVMLTALAEQIGLAAREPQVVAAVAVIESLPGEESALAQDTLQALVQALARAGSPLREQLVSTGSETAARLLADLERSSLVAATDESLSSERRAEAIRNLALAPFERLEGVLAPLLQQRQPQSVQRAALATLARFDRDEVADLLIEGWATFSPSLRAEASEVLLARPQRIAQLLAAVENERLAPGALDPQRVRLLLEHPNDELRARAQLAFAGAQLGRRQDVVAAYADALELPSDVERGRAAFRKVCAACHKVEGQGHDLGPNLAAVQNRGAEAILLAVLDPNREVNPQYVNYAVVTTDGRSMTGMITGETATSLTLTRAEAESDTLLRIDIDEIRSTGLSLMPEGLEQQLDVQALADLIAYLTSLR